MVQCRWSLDAPPHSSLLHPAAATPLANGTHTVMKKDKKFFNQSLAEWKFFIYNYITKSWGLILLFQLVCYGFLVAFFSFTMWTMLQTLNDEVLKYHEQIPSAGLTVFPKPMLALNFSLSLSDSESYQGYTDDRKKCLKPYGLEQKNLTDWNLF